MWSSGVWGGSLMALKSVEWSLDLAVRVLELSITEVSQRRLGLFSTLVVVDMRLRKKLVLTLPDQPCVSSLFQTQFPLAAFSLK